MTLLATPFALPMAELQKPDGSATPSSALHAAGPTLVLIGHMNCKTSKQTLPFIDRIHKDGGRAVAMLQDSPEDAAAGLLKQNLDQEKGADEALTALARAGNNEETLDGEADTDSSENLKISKKPTGGSPPRRPKTVRSRR